MAIENLITNDTKVLELKDKKVSLSTLSRKTHVRKPVLRTWDTWYLHDKDWYFFKAFNGSDDITTKFRFVNELIGEELSNIMELDTIHYEIARINNHLGLASKAFTDKKNRYYFIQDLNIPADCMNLRNFERLREICKTDEEYETVKNEILKLFAIDIYMNQTDRKFKNLQIKKEQRKLHLAPVYDYEKSFQNPEEQIYKSCFARIDLSTKIDEEIPNLKDNLDTLFDLDINDVLETIEDDKKIIIPDNLKEHYKSFVKTRRNIIKRLD